MTYYIIGILAGLLVLTALSAPRKKPFREELKTLSDEDFAEGMRNLARENRIIERGEGLNIRSAVPELDRTNRMISKKVRREQALTEGEKWYYDNINYVKRFAYHYGGRVFARLPRSEGGVRILTVARYIVRNSLERLDYNRVKLAVDTANKEAALTYAEIVTLKSAIGYALVEWICALSGRLRHFDRMQKLGESGRLYPKYLKSDIYLHFALKGKMRAAVSAMLEKMGIETESISFNYAKSIVETTRMARFLFDGIRNLDSLMSGEETLSLLSVNKLLAFRGAYKDMSYETRSDALAAISDISEKNNVSEPSVARKLINFAAYNDMDICSILFDYRKNLLRYIRDNYYLKKVKEKEGTLRQRLYIASCVLAAVGLSIGSYFIFYSIAASLLLFVPFLMLAVCLVNNLLEFSLPGRVLPKMDYKSVPPEHATLVAVSEFITSAEQMKQAVRNLKVIRAGNPDKNIWVSLLADFRASDSPEDASDSALLSAAQEAEGEENIIVFIRKRSKIGKRYKAYERKRGAVMALARMLVTGNREDFAYISTENIPNFEYVLALDADNVLQIGGVREMVNIIAHPANKKYDLISARGRYNLYSVRTPYARQFLRESAFVNYPSYGSLFYNAFGVDIFCGKGIFRLKHFYNKLDGIFPDNKLLSHDILEGAVLNTASGYVVYEDAPVSFVAERERRKRWQRGDIQFLPFLGRYWKNREGERYASDIKPIYKFLMLTNALAILAPVLLFAAGVLAAFFPALWPLFGFAALAPLLLEIISIFRNAVTRKYRLRYLFADLWIALRTSILELGLLPYYAYSNLKITLITLWKMARKKDLLEWKTFFQSQTGAGKFAAEIALSMAVLPIVCGALLLTGTYALPVLLFAVFSYLVNLTEYLMGFRKEEKPRHAEILLSYAEKTYGYFRFMRKDGALIADNLQIRPYKGMSPTTSPTNIGMQILAEISACLLGLTSEREAVETLEAIVADIEKLRKWRGNLYNWYRTDDKTVSVAFVSSVDSGNLTASLMTAHGFLCEKREYAALAARVRRLVDNTDLAALYDPAKKMFYIGYNDKTRRFEGHYDLLASESRLLSFIAASANGGENWRALHRDCAPEYGNTLYSWSGTAFEYLMPDLFVLPPRHSLLYTSAKNAMRMQKGRKIMGLFGLSESGYYAFDDGLRYQYRAFGIEAIALGRDKEKGVVSPYSSFLGLHYLPDAAVGNLWRLQENGMLSEYGFYEAIDLQGKPRILNSYMTHHQGMSLASVCNYLTRGKLRQYFMKDPVAEASAILLTEEPEKRFYSYRTVENAVKPVESKLEYYENTDKVEFSALAAGLTDGAVCSYCDARGSGYTMWNGRLLNRFTSGAYEPGARHFYVKKGAALCSPTYITLGGDAEDFSFSYTPLNASYFNVRHNVKLDVAIEANLGAEVCKLTFEKNEGTEIAFYEPLALSTYEGFQAHPVFGSFFVEAEFVPELNAIIAKRRVRQGEAPLYAAYVARGFEKLHGCCDRFSFLGRCRSERNPVILSDMRTGGCDPSVEPCAGFVGVPEGNTVEIVKLAADSREALLKKLSDLPGNFYDFAIEIGGGVRLSKLTNRLLFPLLSLPYPNDVLAEADISGAAGELMRRTQGRKLIVYEYEDNSSLEGLLRTVRAVDELRYFGVKPSLAVALAEDAGGVYAKNAERALRERLPDATVISKSALGGVLSDRCFLVLDKRLTLPDYFSTVPLPRGFLAPDKKAPVPEDYYLKTGNGGFSDKSGAFVYDLPLAGVPALPYSNVVCGERGGFVATEHGGGFIYFDNSHECRALRFDNDPVKDIPRERVCIGTDKGLYRINGCPGTTDTVRIEPGRSLYFSSFEGIRATAEAYIVDGGDAKITEVGVTSEEGQKRLRFVYSFEGELGTVKCPSFVFCDILSRTTLRMKNLANNQEIYLSLLCDPSGCGETDIRASGSAAVISCTCYPGGPPLYVAVGKKDAVLALTAENIARKKQASLDYFSHLNHARIDTPDKALDMLFNHALMYQVVSSRMNGKCGYYQAGGATGFRDQLQDALALICTDPGRARAQILYHAARQYKEGDVMHWWHHPYFGLRSKISDDKLFLPYVTAEYVEATGDKGILDEVVPYIESPPLSPEEHARYEAAAVSEERGPLIQHCLRAIKNTLKYGEHNLLLLGSGDWNDGLDYIGEQGRAESVMVSIFAYETMRKFAALCEPAIKSELLSIADRLRYSVENFAYDGKQYMRLCGDDGRWYGSENMPCFTIDLVSQAMAVNSGIAAGGRGESALECAKKLVDEENGIIKLLMPPLDEKNYMGYISAYPAGVRENGGQYTHAAVWYIMALLRTGKQAEAYRLLNMINPVSKCRDRVMNARYKGEPYVLSGDVYGGALAGRMGWSWYTGSAAWLYKVILEELFGVKKRGNRLYIEPRLPDALNESTLTMPWGDGKVTILFKKTGQYRLYIGGLLLHERSYLRPEESGENITVEF